MDFDLNTIGSIASVVGLVPSLLQWFQGIGAEQGRQRAATIDEYLEWLRRQDNSQLIQLLSESQEKNTAVAGLIASLATQSAEETESILQRLESQYIGITAKFAGVMDAINTVDRKVGLFIASTVLPGSAESTFEDDYLRHLRKELSRLRVLGVTEMKEVRQSLDVAYISLNLGMADDQQEDEESLQKADEVVRDNMLLTIRGPAGSGKSTLMDWIGLQCATLDQSENQWRGGIPFYVPLRRLQPDDRGQPAFGMLTRYRIDRKIWDAEPPQAWTQAVLEEKRGVILLDGVDELTAEFRPSFWEWVRHFVETYPGNRVYITSRYFPEPEGNGADALWDPPNVFSSAELNEMADPDVRTFIVRWHDAVIAQTNDAAEKSALEGASHALCRKLFDASNVRVRELCRTPLLCAIVCALHWREDGYLPTQRVKLYDRCCTLLIEERDRKREIQPPSGVLARLGQDDKETILQYLALSMMRNKTGAGVRSQQIEISRDEAMAWILPAIRNCDDEAVRNCEPAIVIDFLIERTGLLREPAAGRVDFPHRTFQEYLAACAAGADNQAGDLASHARDDQWRETIILAAGTKVGGVPFGNALVKELLTRGERESKRESRHIFFALAVACLETARQVVPELKDNVLKHLKEIVPPTDIAEARSLSAAGEAVLNYLSYDAHRLRGARVVAACAHAIALIGTERAEAMLLDPRSYGGDPRVTIQRAILEFPGVHPLRVPSIRSALISSGIKTSLSPYIVDIEPVAQWNDIPRLNLSGCESLTDLSPLKQLLKLDTLFINFCTQIRDLSALREIPSLIWLGLAGCIGVSDFSALSSLRNLRYLRADLTRLGDLSMLRDASQLRFLDIDDCSKIKSLEPLACLSNLTQLRLCGTRIADLAPLCQLPNLRNIIVYKDFDGTIPDELDAKVVRVQRRSS